MLLGPQKPPSGQSRATPEAQLAEWILGIQDEVARAKIQTFLDFAKDRAAIKVHVEHSRDHAVRLTLTYPPPGA